MSSLTVVNLLALLKNIKNILDRLTSQPNYTVSRAELLAVVEVTVRFTTLFFASAHRLSATPMDYSGSHHRYSDAPPPRKQMRPSLRRRRPSLWDSREYQYGIPVPPPRGTLPNDTRIMRQSTEKRKVLRTPRMGESGPLASIDIPVLRALLSGNDPGPAVPVNDGIWAVRGAKKVYVGNLPDSATESIVMQFFNQVLRESNGTESNEPPIVSCYLNKDKRFAFIETRTVSEAAACLMLDGLHFQQIALRIRKPNDYPAVAATARPPSGFDPTKLGIVGTQVSDGPNKLFIGGIPYHLSEDQIKELLRTYGELAAFNLVKEPTSGQSKGYAFCEFVDHSVIDAACAGLNGMQVDDKQLTVRRASTYPPGFDPTSSGSIPPMALGSQSVGALGRADGGNLLGSSTTILELKNVIDEAELEDEEEYNDIIEEMEDEGKKYGELLTVLVPRPKKGESETEAHSRGVGRVFLKYASVKECERAQATLSGRKFDQRVVHASFYDEDKFKKRDFS